MGRAKTMQVRRKPPRKGMPLEQWVVFGIDRWGEPFIHEEYNRADADRMAERVNARGGNVDVRREVWNSPAAAYRAPLEVV